MIVIDRIQEAIKAGELPRFNESKQLKAVKKVKDYLIPYSEFFYEGAEFLNHDFNLHKPVFEPSPRRDPRRIPPLKDMKAPNKMVARTMFDSMKAVNHYYAKRDYVVPKKILNAKANSDGLYAFAEPLIEFLDYPLATPIENFEMHDEVPNFWLMLPVMSYEQEEAGILEAFITGAENIAGMLIHLDGDSDLELLPNERKLIKKVGYVELCKFYQESDDKDKTVDITYLENWYENFFEPLEKKYPTINIQKVPIISGQGYEEIDILDVVDIEFAVDFTLAYEDMMSRMPDIYAMEHDRELDTTEEFIRDVLRVWKKGH